MLRTELSCFVNHERPPIDVAAVNVRPSYPYSLVWLLICALLDRSSGLSW